MSSKDNDKTIVGGFSLDLIYTIESDNGEKFIVEDEVVVGRGKDCGIFIDDKKISRKHAQLKIINARLEVTDLDSSNGTFLNGNKIDKPMNLSNGDVVSFEKHTFTVAISMNEQPQDLDVETVEEEDDDHTAVMDFTPEQLEKLHKAPEPVAPEPVTPEPVTPEKQEVVNEPKPDVVSEKEAVPSSWIEETGAVQGTRMLDMSELNALRAGIKDAVVNESQVTRLHCFVEGKEEVFELPITDINQASGWEIGRDSTCDIVIDHGSVSNRHAQIIHQNGRWKIVNLVSTNGILINGQKRLSTYLSDGDKVGVGSVSLVLKIPKSHQKNAKNAVPKPEKSSNKNLLVPAILGLIIVVLMIVIFFYLK